MWADISLFVAGGFAVWFGAEGMVRGAVKLAAFLGVPSLIIGLTVVAFGTSAPELVVSIFAAARGHSQIALGNVIGSNIINIGLVLGISALLAPIKVSTEVLRRDIPILAGVTLIVVLLAWLGGEVGRIDGGLLLLGFVAHTIMSYKLGVKEQMRTTSLPGWVQPELKTQHVVFLIGGTVILAAGAEGMVRGAVGVAETLGISQRIIGVTIVALGTSLPELAASAVAAKQGEGDMAIGNIVGSNLYNVLLILGTASIIRPAASNIGSGSVDFAFFVLFALVLFPMIRVGWRLGRFDGLSLLLLYVAFNVLLFV